MTLKSNLSSNNEQGFSLIEILVALALVSIMGTFIAGYFDTERAELDKHLSKLELATSLIENEALFRNSFARIKFDLQEIGSEEVQTYTLQYGNTKDLVIDPELLDVEDPDEATLARIKKQNQNFTILPEVEEGKVQLPWQVKIYGVGTGLSKKLSTEGQVAIYTFPSGEKDSAIIILGTEAEIATLEINPFETRLERNYYKLEDTMDDQDRQDFIEGLYKSWLKK